MDKHNQKTKTILITAIAVLMFIATISSALAFPHGLAMDNLKSSFWYPDSKGLTIAGEQRQCIEQPVESHTIYFPTKGFTMQMQCEQEPALINLYYVNDKEVWDFSKGGEFESPAAFKTTESGMWAWECYTCQAEVECDSGYAGYACKTMTAKQSCINGKFYGNPIQCGNGEYCDNGKCVNPLEMEPKWICNDWGDCKADKNGKLYQSRICYDARATGSTVGMPVSIQSCTKEEYKKDSADDGSGLYEPNPEDSVTVPGATVTPPTGNNGDSDFSFKWGWLIAFAGIGFAIGLFIIGGTIEIGFIFGVVGALLGLIINLIMWMV